jgi:biopolymer transport protein ExbD
MAISTSGNGRGSRRRTTPALSEINVTPFVDVVLVLLIIFMLTAHVMEYGVEVNVPETKGTKQATQELPVISISKEGIYTMDGKEININQIPAAIRQKRNPRKAVYVRADRETSWDVVAQVTAHVAEAGFQVNLVTRQFEGSSQK